VQEAFAAIVAPAAQAKPVPSPFHSYGPISSEVSLSGGVTPTLAQLEAEAQAMSWKSRLDSYGTQSNVSLSSIHGGTTPTMTQLEAQAAQYRANLDASQSTQSSIHGGTTPTLAQLEAQAAQYRAKLDESQTTSAVVRSDGFDWSDAGIGGSIAFGAALLLLTSVGLGKRYRSRLDGTGLAST